MEDIVRAIVKSYYVPLEWVEIDHTFLMVNPNPKLGKFMHNNIDKIPLYKAIYGLNGTESEIEPVNSELVYRLLEPIKLLAPTLMFDQTEVKFAKHIIQAIEKDPRLKTDPKLQFNSNPGLTQFLINGKYDLSGNSNPELTEYIKQILDQWRGVIYLRDNTNPALADVIIDNEHYSLLGNNSNPGLTEHIIKNKVPCHGNTNPNLAEYIISINEKRPNWSGISRNSNNGLYEYIVINHKKLDYRKLSLNSNPKLLDFMYTVRDKLYMPWMSRNPIIAKLKQFKLE